MTFPDKQIDLQARAHVEMVAHGFKPDFEPAVAQEVATIKSEHSTNESEGRDLRNLLWSSIDNPDSKDLDQLEYVEPLNGDQVRLLVAIADVDSYAPKDSAIDKHAFTNTTSVYTGIVTFSMLPNELSFDLTSLIQDVDRQAIIIDLIIDNTGAVIKSEIYAGLVRNHAKLDYIMVGQWLEIGGKAPDRIASVPGLEEQLLLQSKLKEKIRALRQKQGSLNLHTLEVTTVAANGQVLDLEEVEENPARDLIENFMISSNIAVSQFLEAQKLPSLRRIVKIPERWDRIVQVASQYETDLPNKPDARALAIFLLKQKAEDPIHFPDLSLTIVKLLGRGEYVVEVPGQVDQGHFALAVHDYTHATAPNRRYPDLVTQRLIKSVIAKKGQPYTLEELNDIALHCTQKEEDAKKVERTMRKVAAAVFLSKHIGETFDGIVTGINKDGTYVRTFKPPVEGKIVQGEHGLDVGDKVKLKLVDTDPEQAYIDFARIRK